ncbi:Large ribosomal subunit protein uL1c-like protein, partial [Drosera capensis]
VCGSLWSRFYCLHAKFVVILFLKKKSRRYLELQTLREFKKEYDVKTTISLLKQMGRAKFVETVEAHFRLNIDPRYNDQQIRATVDLPKGSGKSIKIAVLAQGERLDEPKNAGADIVGGDELIEQRKNGFMEFDKLIASPDMMPKVFLFYPSGSYFFAATKIIKIFSE